MGGNHLIFRSKNAWCFTLCDTKFSFKNAMKLQCSLLASGTAIGKDEAQLIIDPFCKIVPMLQEVIRHTSFQGDPRLIGLVY